MIQQQIHTHRPREIGDNRLHSYLLHTKDDENKTESAETKENANDEKTSIHQIQHKL